MAATRKVLLAIDASDQSELAFHWYLSTIHRSDNEVVLVHVAESLDADRSRMMHLTAASFEEAVKKDQAKMKELEDKYSTKILENGMAGRIRSECGNKPGEVICRVAEEEEVTMIVLGTRGLGKVRRTIMGSVSDYVVHHAHCPVVVCRQQN